MMTYDFAVLGDTQPEGLLAAAGLVRKGFSVIVVPSTALAELPPDENWPLVLPSQMGSRKLNDLLFRAGFFRLEESGLTAVSVANQVLLQKNRLLFEGTSSQWLGEIEREFPHALKTFSQLFDQAKRMSPQQIHRAASELMEIQKRDCHFRAWLFTELHFSFKWISEELSLDLLKQWLQFILKQENKAYRVDPKIKTSYNQFLLEHAKKWGAVVCGDLVDLKVAWTLFQITNTIKASHLILNGMGGGRILGKTIFPKLGERMKFWMYLDSLTCSASQIPEPLEEFSQINYGETVGDLPAERRLHLSIDRVRGEAHLSLGSWLSFEDSKNWVHQIEKGRATLKKFIPFLPDSTFKPILSLLELTEQRGECIRRGEADRLIPETAKISTLDRLIHNLWKRLPRKRKPRTLARRIYAINPHYLSRRNRLASFEEALVLLDHFEKKKRAQVASS
jgi:hypothetical protein